MILILTNKEGRGITFVTDEWMSIGEPISPYWAMDGKISPPNRLCLIPLAPFTGLTRLFQLAGEERIGQTSR